MAEVTRLRRRHENWTRSGPVVSDMDENEITALGDRAAATLADPTPMGLWVFATGTWILGTLYAGVFSTPTPTAPSAAATATVPVLVVISGVALFIAGLYAYRRANVLISTAFCCFGAFYIATGLLFAMQARGILTPNGDPVTILGFLFESFAFMALALAVAALQTNMALVAVLITLCVGLVLTGIPNLSGSGGTSTAGEIGGWFLWASAFFAYYTGAALVVNSIWEQTALPMGGEPM